MFFILHNIYIKYFQLLLNIIIKYINIIYIIRIDLKTRARIQKLLTADFNVNIIL